MIAIIISILIIAYILLVLLFWLGWEKAQPCQDKEIFLQPVSIIVAVRNEAENITNLLSDFKNQTYPHDLLELIIVDDHSSDATVSKIKDFAGDSSGKIILLKLDKEEGKKAAINKAIDSSNNEIILTTDGDCRFGPEWVFSMLACFYNDKIQLVSGPVKMFPQASLFQRIQSIEFSSLISAGAATLTMGWPTMANAANMAFRKSTYYKVKGSNSEISSGDDVFLLHKIGKYFNNATIFCRDEKAIVDTMASNDLVSFYNQRKRWAGKWQFYHDIPTILLAVFIFTVNLAMFSLPFLVLADALNWVLATNLFVVKFVFEFWYLREVQRFFKTKFLLHEFTILAIIYPVYVTFMALAGLMGKYRWKERNTI